MLRIFQNKLCPLLSLMMATMGCGKKITESTTESAHVETQEMPSALVIQLNSIKSYQTIFDVPRNANVTLPDALIVRAGSALGRSVSISYNLEHTDEDFEYQCTYRSTFAHDKMPLEKCVSYLGEIFSDVTRFQFPIYYGRKIRMKLDDGLPGITVDAVYSVDWK